MESGLEPERKLEGGSCPLPHASLSSALLRGVILGSVWNPWMLETLRFLRVQAVSAPFLCHLCRILEK